MKGKNTQSIPPLKHNDKIITNPREKAELLNSYFVNQTNLKEENVPTPLLRKKTLNELSEVIITHTEIVDQLKILKVNKSYGPDQISPYILNKCRETLSYPIWKLIKWSFESETLPYCWKRAYITPIHKKRGQRCSGKLQACCSNIHSMQNSGKNTFQTHI